MLLGMEIKNINSIGDCKIDFTKAKYKYLESAIMNDKVVSPAVIYGHNGSGKSSFIMSISSLVQMMIDSPDRIYAFTENKLNTKNLKAKLEKNKDLNIEEYRDMFSSITLYLSLSNKIYIYTISTSPFKDIVYEGLNCDNKIIFERNDMEYNYLGESKKIESGLTMFPYLRKLANDNLRDNDLNNVYNYISNIAVIHADRKTFKIKGLLNKSYKDLMVEKSGEIRKILNDYEEFPLYTIGKENIDLESLTEKSFNIKNYFFELEFDNNTLKLPFELISSGMENQSFVLAVLLSLPQNSVLMIDELEQALHPTTITSFLNVVREKKIQLIFTCHNTNVMQELRPDQIYFSKWKKGYSSIIRLSDIYPNIREINNIEKMYLNNVFDIEGD